MLKPLAVGYGSVLKRKGGTVVFILKRKLALPTERPINFLLALFRGVYVFFITVITPLALIPSIYTQEPRKTMHRIGKNEGGAIMHAETAMEAVFILEVGLVE